MSFLIRKGENNWLYVLIVAVITAIVGVAILNYTNETIKEINSLHQYSEIEIQE